MLFNLTLTLEKDNKLISKSQFQSSVTITTVIIHFFYLSSQTPESSEIMTSYKKIVALEW